MKLVDKILKEAAGVPLVVNSYVDKIKQDFLKNPSLLTKNFSKDFTFGAKSNFPLKEIKFSYSVHYSDNNMPSYVNANVGPLEEIDGGYVAIINLDANYLSATEINESDAILKIASAITHELTHAFESYNRKKQNFGGLATAKGNVANQFSNQAISDAPGSVKELLFYIYCSASFELNVELHKCILS